MKTDSSSSDFAENDPQTISRFYVALPEAVRALVASLGKEDGFNQLNATPAIHLGAVIDVISQARRLLFPGYFAQSRLHAFNLEYSFARASPIPDAAPVIQTVFPL